MKKWLTWKKFKETFINVFTYGCFATMIVGGMTLFAYGFSIPRIMFSVIGFLLVVIGMTLACMYATCEVEDEKQD